MAWNMKMRVNECIYTTVVSKTNVVKGTAREIKMTSKYHVKHVKWYAQIYTTIPTVLNVTDSISTP